MLLIHDFVGDDGIRHEAKTWKLLPERFQNLVTPTVVNLTAELAQWQLKGSERLNSFIVRWAELLTKITTSNENIFRDSFKRLDPQWSVNELWNFVIKKEEKFSTLQQTLQSRPKGGRIFYEITTQRQKAHTDSVALAMKLHLKKGPEKRDWFLCWIPGQFAMDCRRKESSQCRKCDERGQLDRAWKRRDGGNYASVAMGHWLHQISITWWKTAGMLDDSGCSDRIQTKIDPFLDVEPLRSVVRNPNGESTKRCVRISIPSNRGEIPWEMQNVLCVPDYSLNILSVSEFSGQSFTLEKRNSSIRHQKETRVKLTKKYVVLLILQRSRTQDEFPQREIWQCREEA